MKTSIDVRNMCEEHQIKMIDFKMIDINGRWHHVTIPVARFTEDIFTYGIGHGGRRSLCRNSYADDERRCMCNR